MREFGLVAELKAEMGDDVEAIIVMSHIYCHIFYDSTTHN